MKHYPYSMLVYDNSAHVSGIHHESYINFIIFHPPEEVISIASLSNRISLILKEKYNALIREEQLDFPHVRVYLDFETEQDKFAFLMEWA